MAFAGNTPGQGRPRPTPIYKDWTVLQLAALVLLIDQFTKYLVIELLPFRSSFPSEGFFRFTHVHNTGSAFGTLQGLNTPLIFVSFIGVAILVLIYRSQPYPSNWLRLSLALQLGGAFGNLIDRLRLGYVTDFIDVGPWPVFNLADASIVTGLVLLAWIFLRPGQEKAPGPAPGAGESQAQGRVFGWCPICDGEMVAAPGGWRCLSCGVRERIDLKGAAPEQKQLNVYAVARDSAPGSLIQDFSGNHSRPSPEDLGGKDASPWHSEIEDAGEVVSTSRREETDLPSRNSTDTP